MATSRRSRCVVVYSKNNVVGNLSGRRSFESVTVNAAESILSKLNGWLCCQNVFPRGSRYRHIAEQGTRHHTGSGEEA
jgi:hypothetical protein